MKRILLYIFFIFFSLTSFSQTGTVKGFIYDKETGEAVLFTNVYLKGTRIGTATDLNGFFFINNIPVGKYTLEVSYLGYTTYNKAINIEKDKTLSLKIHLEKSANRLDDVIISAKRQEMKTEVRMSVVKLSPKEITQLPSMGSEPDLAQAIQTIPGVIFTGDQGGQLYIRGGAPIQNKVLLDGMTIFQPFHSIGFFSVFETDAISSADVYTGGFNAEYGGRISSIMDIALRGGNKKKTKGKVAMSTFGASFLADGPIIKQKENSPQSLTYLAYGKTSYLKQTSKYFYPYANKDGLPFNYNDLFAKLTYNMDNGSKLSLFGFNFNDAVNFKSVSDYSWDQYGIGSKIMIVPENVPTILMIRTSYSNYKINLENTDGFKRTSQINSFNFGLNLHYFLGKNEVDYGFEGIGGKTDFQFTNAVGRQISQVENTTEMAAYVKTKFITGRLIFEPGFRAHYYASLNNLSFEPRLGIKFNMLEYLRFKVAAGMYSQNLIAATSDRDVVNLFYGFLSGPDNLPKSFKGELLTHKLQKAKHLILGTEIDINRYIDVNIEGYIKYFDQLTNLNRNKIYDDNTENKDEPDELKKDFIIETGKAYGADISVNYKKNNIKIWAVYSLGFVNRDDGNIIYRTHFDRRHNVNLMGDYSFGNKKSWSFSIRWNYGSGFPFTPVQGYYEQLTLQNSINPDVQSFNGQVGTIYGPINSQELSDYHRLDISMKKTIYIKKNKLLVSLSITNVYNRRNIFYVDNFNNEKMYQLPILPSIGLTYKF